MKHFNLQEDPDRVRNAADQPARNGPGRLLKDYPGYVDFGELSSIFGEPTVQIAVGESLLGLVGSLSASEDPEAAELFNRLNGVRVNVFETTAMAERRD